MTAGHDHDAHAARAGAALVTLVDGTEVRADSEEYRHECEARAICALPTLADRRAWLEGIEHKRGKDAADRLRATIVKLWEIGP